MKKMLFSSLFFCCTILAAHTQAQQAINPSIRATNILARGGTIGAGDLIVGLPSNRLSNVVGDSYWDKHWGASALLLYQKDQLVEGHLTRYDIQNDEFEFQLNNQVKVLPGVKVKNAVWIDSLTQEKRFLVNAKEYQTSGVPLTGFFEVLVDGKSALLKQVQLEVLKPDFNPALNVGSKDTRIIKRDVYFYNVGNEVYKIKSKKDLEALPQGKGDQLNGFIKDEKIKLSKEKDLIKLFNFYQSL